MGFKPLTELLIDQIVILVVGRDLKPYHVHRDLICDRSAHFRAALEGQFHEAQTGRLELRDDEEATIELFIRWLYGSINRSILTLKELHHYVSLMCFARRILLTELHNDCMDSIRQHFRLQAQQKQQMEDDESEVERVSVQDVAMAYAALPELPHLRFCLCLEKARQVNDDIQEGMLGWMSADLC
ncbi:MAG: hypothetical protein Q9182_005137 [Xanthomendoza sp. 2 TL-2023]